MKIVYESPKLSKAKCERGNLRNHPQKLHFAAQGRPGACVCPFSREVVVQQMKEEDIIDTMVQ